MPEMNMARTLDVVALGNAIVDVLAPVDDAFLLTHNIAKGVMTLIDEYRAQQLYGVFPAERREVAGGSAANTITGLASFGGHGAFLGKVKEDRLGHSFASSMKDLGIRFNTAFAEEGPATACCLVAVAPDGQRSMNTFLGASRELSASDIRKADIADAEILYIEGYLWDSEPAREASRKAIDIAKDAGARVAFTLSDPFCVGRYREEFLELLENELDIVFANEDEAKALFGAQEFDSVLQRFEDWGGVAALTRSEKGCVVVGQGETHVIDAVPVKQVVDTTGAGDQFAAGFLFGLTHGKNFNVCGKLGALAASEVISHYGARPETSLAALAKNLSLI
jgi:sugar/nucleoside kinase (ribokinase family)